MGSTPPYGHDGRSINLREVILRHGGEAQAQRDAFAALPESKQEALVKFLESLVLFPPDDTASNLIQATRMRRPSRKTAMGAFCYACCLMIRAILSNRRPQGSPLRSARAPGLWPR